MAAWMPYSHSQRGRAVDPVTPAHSPHHSLNSSTSSRTTSQPLTLHEYRKQQNSPAPHSITPPGKTLRRKAAASSLVEAERVPSLSRIPLKTPLALPCSLHESQSAHQLASYRALPPSPPPFHQQHGPCIPPLRTQSAEPHSLRAAGTESAGFAARSTRKVRDFKPIKRLPKPPLAVTPPHQQLWPRGSTPFSLLENSKSSVTQTTPSTFSLSRFPQPPHVVDPSLSPPNNGNAPPRLNAAGFTTTAPATPPATPAVIHYRGTSFDLINPHNSLSLHEIVTPSRDFGSTDYLPLRSSEDLFADSEMAPKRALYGDLTSAYASILTRRSEDWGAPPNLELPLPPILVARSPASSQLITPLHSPGSNFSLSPRTLSKTDNEPRFSLKQLTRSLTRRIGKISETPQDEELQNLPGSRASLASVDFDGEFPRPLNRSYPVAAPKTSNSSDDPLTPTSPLDHAVTVIKQHDSESSLGHARFSSPCNSAPLTSMFPDHSSREVGRASDPQSFMLDSYMCSMTCHDELASIYPSSSIYTAEDQNRSTYAPSFSSDRKSNLFAHTSNGVDELADEFKLDALHKYSKPRRTGGRVSRPLTQEILHHSLQQGNYKADTISKFIDQYKRSDSTDTSGPTFGQLHADDPGLVASSPGASEELPRTERHDFSRFRSDPSQLEPNLSQPSGSNRHSEEAACPSVYADHARTSNFSCGIGMPPANPLPLAPAFEHVGFYHTSRQPQPPASDLFSGPSSYEDTHQLLQLSKLDLTGFVSESALEPSSSYSQPEILIGAQTSLEALANVDDIIPKAVAQQQKVIIPAMWAKRNSGHLLRSRSEASNIVEKKLDRIKTTTTPVIEANHEEDIGDWETVGNDSNAGRLTPGESIADYSSSEGNRDSLDFSSSLPIIEHLPLEPGSFKYQRSDLSDIQPHPITSFPLPLIPRASGLPPPNKDCFHSPVSSMRVAVGAPELLSSHDVNEHSSGSLHAFAPWANHYSLNDKETQELLASGPNDEILYDNSSPQAEEEDSKGFLLNKNEPCSTPVHRAESPTTSLLGQVSGSHGLERENTFEKFSMLGPRGNTTGTPHGTGMHEAGSSAADNSSPGVMFSSSPYEASRQPGCRSPPVHTPSGRIGVPSIASRSSRYSRSHDPPIFYASPSRTASVHHIQPRLVVSSSSPQHDTTTSQMTLFSQSILGKSPVADSSRRFGRHSLGLSSSPRRPRCLSRAAVHGQTKLRQMVLAPDTRSISSEHSENISYCMGLDGSGRPSTSNTHTPLRTHVSESTLITTVAYEHSPHLLCPERAIDPLEEEDRRKLSWILFGVFCIMPPMLILYRWMGDMVIVNVTKGRIRHVALKPKSIALGVGIAVNVSLSTVILLPILIAHATGTL